MRTKALMLLGGALLAPSAMAQPHAPAPMTRAKAAGALPAGADMRALAAQMRLSHETFTLPNGLRVLVHTDRSVPLVAVSVWYDVGSKHEPKGHTGFAHLFEHLMFNGSENVPGDYFRPLQEAGATDSNGTTAEDRTNYYETVPTGALERVLFMESDRMGHLLGAVNQATLDEQRGVVQNEKRQGDDDPYSVIDERITGAIFPATHPYGHPVVGSMADLDAASLADVRGWFRQNYGPNNALLMLAGDIDVATAKRLATKYFGDIARGPATHRPDAPIPDLPKRLEETVTAPIPTATIVRAWAVPGSGDPAAIGLDAAAGTLGGIDAALLNRVLVRDRKLFSRITVSNDTLAQGGRFSIRGRVSPGVDPKIASAALDATIGDYLAHGPSADEVERWKTGVTVAIARRMESLTTRAEMLAEGMLFRGDADAYRRDVEGTVAQTPATALAAARRWLGRPAYALTVLPGAGTRDADRVARTPAAAAAAAAQEPAPARQARMPMPAIVPPADPHFPAVSHLALANGIRVIYAASRRAPFTSITLQFPAGSRVDPQDRRGLQAMTFATLDKGIPGYDSMAIEAYKERLGIDLSAGSSVDHGLVMMTTPSVNAAQSLTLLARVVTHPTFPAAEVERVRRQRMEAIDQQRVNAGALSGRVLQSLMDAASPYALHPPMGDAAVLRALTPADLASNARRWLRPEGATLFIVSDRPLAELRPMIERTIGAWAVPGAATPLPPRTAPQLATPQIVLVDRRDSAQATIGGGQAIAPAATEAMADLDIANVALGGGFLSRINMNLREDKHWSYGASGSFRFRPLGSTYEVRTSVQIDKAGAALAEIRREVGDFLTTRPMNAGEFTLAMDGRLRGMANWFTTADAVMGALQENDEQGRPDDYYDTLPARYRAMTPPVLNADMRRTLAPARWVWTIVGDADVIRPQLATLGLPVRVTKPEEVVPR